MASAVSSSPSVLEYFKARGYSLRGVEGCIRDVSLTIVAVVGRWVLGEWSIESSVRRRNPKNRGVGGGVCGPMIGFASDAAKIAKTDLSKKSTTDSREQQLPTHDIPHNCLVSLSTETSLLKSLSLIAHATSLKYVSGLT